MVRAIKQIINTFGETLCNFIFITLYFLPHFPHNVVIFKFEIKLSNLKLTIFPDILRRTNTSVELTSKFLKMENTARNTKTLHLLISTYIIKELKTTCPGCEIAGIYFFLYNNST